MQATIALVDDDRNILTSVSIALEADGRAPAIYIERSQLQRVLLQQVRRLGPDDVSFGVRCHAVGRDVDATGRRAVALFDVHGRTVGASDVVVAADGIRSPIRAQLLRDGPPRATAP